MVIAYSLQLGNSIKETTAMYYNFEIINWKKYNPRKDVEKPSWLRLENSILSNPDFALLSKDEKLLWIILLMIASRENKMGEARVHENYVVRELELAAVNQSPHPVVSNMFKRLAGINFLKLKSRNGGVRRRDVDVTCANVDGPTNETNGNERNETNERKNICSFSTKMRVTLEQAYQLYPLKKGKKRGMDKLKRVIKTEEDAQKLKCAIEKYNEEIKKEKTESKYIMHFSTFVNRYEDFLDDDYGSSVVGNSPKAEATRFIEQMNKLSAEDRT